MAKYNPERKTWRGRSYKAGGKRIRELKYRQVLPVLASVTFLLLTACAYSPEEQQARAAAQVAYQQAYSESMKDKAVSIEAVQDQIKHDEAQDAINSFTYVQDKRSGVCYAYSWLGSRFYSSPTVFPVPCTDDVMKLIK